MSKQKKPAENDGRRVVARNRKARHDYHITDTIEAGLVLSGPEVKSVRAGKITLTGGYVTIDEGEAWLREVNITPYEHATGTILDPNRPRKLLLKRRELDRLAARSNESGWTLVPLEVYFARGFAKLELGIAHGKREYDKREAIRQRETEMERSRALAASRRE